MKTFNDKAVGVIRDTVRRVQAMPRTSGTALPEGALPPLPMYICKTPAGGIAARSGTTPGSATCTLWTNSGGTLAEWVSPQGAAQTVTVYNLSTSAVSAAAYIIACGELLGGTLLAMWEDCT